ncbi:hypothetical protein [Microbulbifer thermotolerans]|uniref:hypothetical protein n=1 Tax=Microbulbifer thermotolerans TaxID=252514 RepID=UPI00224ADAD6|nr:hypothetical protein [Microbulbifer thermotolerans]MCX2780731.1 hypothetical protein [Microbulbifer thermotolerans]MCX2806470.1 hypothetical protein [Microbulbifer thermotolerans]
MLRLFSIGGVSWRFSFAAIFCLLLSSCLGLLLGQDLNWDAINYHFYLPNLMLNDRFEQDFFAAGKQSYLNPLLYFPFYYMVVSGVHPVIIVIVLSFLQGFTFFVLFLFVKALLKDKLSFSFLLLVFFVCAFCPIALQLIGTTFSDLFIAGFQLASLLFLVISSEDGCWKRLFVSGFLMASAAGFKYVYVIYCLPLGVAVLVMFWGQGERLFKALLACFCGGVAGFLVVDGWWAYKLYLEFGNPTFPYFNGIFSSDFYFDVSYPIDRFRKDSVLEVISFPFKVALPNSYYYSEVISPDIRLAFSFFLIAISFGAYIFCLGKFLSPVTWSLLTFFLTSYLIWAWISGNGRYALIILFVAPVLAVLMSCQIFSGKIQRIYWLVAFILQLFITLVVGNPRWSPIEWADEWYAYTVPIEISSKPALFLSGEVISFSFLTGKVHPDSSFVTARGQIPFPDMPATMDRLDSLLERVESGIVWGLSYYATDDQMSTAYDSSMINAKVFSRLGFSVTDQCYEIKPHYMQYGMIPVSIAACRLKYDTDLLKLTRFQHSEADRIFEKMAKLCKDLFSPSVTPPLQFGSQWEAVYPGTENILILNNGVFLARPKRGTYLVKLTNADSVDELNSCPLETLDI